MTLVSQRTQTTEHRPTQHKDRTTHYARPRIFAGVRSIGPLPLGSLARQSLRAREGSPFHSIVCARPRPIHPSHPRRHPRPSLDAQPPDPHPGSIPAARRLFHCLPPSPGWASGIPFAFSKPPSPRLLPMANTASPTAPTFSSPPL